MPDESNGVGYRHPPFDRADRSRIPHPGGKGLEAMNTGRRRITDVKRYGEIAWGLLVLILAVAGVSLAGRLQRAEDPPFDLLIVNGRILDGSGSPWFAGSVAVKNGKIADLGRLPGATAKQVIDARGLVVSPGFIDLHSHSDFTLLVDGAAQSKIRQGVTTEILGEAGSAAPVLGPVVADFDRSLRPYGIERDWTSYAQYFARLERQGTSVNVASYVGSGQVRGCIMGNVNRAPSSGEMERMRALVEQAMRDGTIGLSSGLIYPPNSFAQTEELIELAKVAARYGGVYASHIRSESETSLEALDEAIAISERAGLPTHIFHFKKYGRDNWGGMGEQVTRIQAARDRGVEITADQYPYIAAMTGLEMCIPPKYMEGSSAEFVARLKDPKVRAEIRKAIETGLPGWGDNEVKSVGGWHGVLVAAMQKPENKKYEGMRMDAVAKAMGTDPLDALCDLLISEGGSADAVYFGMSEPDVSLAMQQSWVGIGSDGSAVSPEMTFIGRPHPRFYGTFPRVLGYYVREQKLLTLPEAIRKMTSFSAQLNGLTDRGLLRPGMAADITVFDPNTVADKATFESPLQYSVGIEYVIVNGTVVLNKGQHTGAKPGRVLYGRGKS
jgi:N-acyl-D-amino-acid deacylase